MQSLKKEIERRIEVIPKIQQEPQLISDPRYIMAPGSQVPPHYYRLKAVDDIKTLGNQIYFFNLTLRITQVLAIVSAFQIRNLFCFS